MVAATEQKTKSMLEQKLHNEVWPKVTEKYGIKNPMALPRIDKIVLNVGVGNFLENNKLKPEIRDAVLGTLTTVTGQKPVMIKARKSVSNFKVRAGALASSMVTLRRDRMWAFFERLIHLAIPRVRDFRGMNPNSFDKAGNYSFGFSEQAVWPEIDMGKVNISHGMHINIIIKNSNPEISRFVMTELGFPFKREDND